MKFRRDYYDDWKGRTFAALPEDQVHAARGIFGNVLNGCILYVQFARRHRMAKANMHKIRVCAELEKVNMWSSQEDVLFEDLVLPTPPPHPNRKILTELIAAAKPFLVDSIQIDPANGDCVPDIYQCTGCGATDVGQEPKKHHDGCIMKRLREAIDKASPLLKE